MAEFLYDHPRTYYLYGCVTDGAFDPKKAAELGYGPAQFEAIEKFLALEEPAHVDTNPLPEIEVAEDD